MRKLFIIACAFAAAIGCQKQEIDQPQVNEGVKVPLNITASITQTKTTMTNENGVLKSAWKNGDKIYITRFEHQTYVKGNSVEYSAEVSDQQVQFVTASEDGIIVPESNPSYYSLLAEYPVLGSSYGTQRKFSMKDLQIQSVPGDLSHIADSDLMFAWASPDWTQIPLVANFEMKHALSVLQLNLKGNKEGVKINKIEVEMLDESGLDYLVVTDGTIDMRNGGAIKQNKGENVMTLSLGSLTELPVNEYAQFYMTISPGHAGQTFKVAAFTEFGERIEVGTMKVPSDGSIPQGAKAVKSFTVQAPEKEEIDPSSVIDLSANGTANTYIVTAPNTVYKFNAQVMGNGTLPTKMADIISSTQISPRTALSLWYTCKQTSTNWKDQTPVEISSIELKEDGYIYFKTPETFVNGNIVIAAFEESGLTYSNIEVNENREFTNATILWSWDIWAVEGYAPETSSIAVGDQSLMDRNLGALVAYSDSDANANIANGVWVANAQGNYYEFGRKDPFPGFAEYPAYYPQQYGQKLLTTPTYTLITALQTHSVGASGKLNNQMFGDEAASCTKVTSIKGKYTEAELLDYVNGNPHKDIQGNNPYNWQIDQLDRYWKDMWGGESSNAPTYKTIYDPCPAGWKLWDYNTMETFVLANEDTATTFTDSKQTCFGVLVGDSMFPFNGGGKGYGLGLNTYGCLINVQVNTTAPIALYTASPYYYLASTNKMYSGSYSAVTDWKVTVTADGMDLSMTYLDEDNDNRVCANTATAYTSRAIPVRCIKE